MKLKPNTFYKIDHFVFRQENKYSNTWERFVRYNVIVFHKEINGKNQLLINDKFVDFNDKGFFRLEDETCYIARAVEL